MSLDLNLLKNIENLDLDISNYSLKDLYNLFQIDKNNLNQSSLKYAKNKVLNMHPDKSKLDAKFFLFFSNAYKKLYNIYEFQNKLINNKKLEEKLEEKLGEKIIFKEENKLLLENFIVNENHGKLKDPKEFNKWFNLQFEKFNLNHDLEDGYGDWLKSNEGFYTNENANYSNEEFEKQKKIVKSLTKYKGYSDPFTSTLGGSILGKNDDFSSGLFETLNFQDVRQAHLETIIPVCIEDYNLIPKYKSSQEYKIIRDNQNLNPLSHSESIKKLKNKEDEQENESAYLAFNYATQLQNSEKTNNIFWSSLNHLTNG